jgi:translation initiation factor 2-alpha kinase 3
MELCNEGSLDRYLQKRKNINRDFAFIIFDQLLNGVNYLHLNGLIHRDLKPGNILINKK